MCMWQYPRLAPGQYRVAISYDTSGVYGLGEGRGKRLADTVKLEMRR